MDIANLKFKEYELQAKKTASYHHPDYLPLGLAEECGELVQVFAEAKRKNVGIDSGKVMSEMGDVLWVLSQIAREFNFSLEDAAINNMDKLERRLEKGSIHEKSNR